MAIAEAYRKKKEEKNKSLHIRVNKEGNFMKSTKAEMSKLNASKPTIILMLFTYNVLLRHCYRIMNTPTQSTNCLVQILFTNKMFTVC